MAYATIDFKRKEISNLGIKRTQTTSCKKSESYRLGADKMYLLFIFVSYKKISVRFFIELFY